MEESTNLISITLFLSSRSTLVVQHRGSLSTPILLFLGPKNIWWFRVGCSWGFRGLRAVFNRFTYLWISCVQVCRPCFCISAGSSFLIGSCLGWTWNSKANCLLPRSTSTDGNPPHFYLEPLSSWRCCKPSLIVVTPELSSRISSWSNKGPSIFMIHLNLRVRFFCPSMPTSPPSGDSLTVASDHLLPISSVLPIRHFAPFKFVSSFNRCSSAEIRIF